MIWGFCCSDCPRFCWYVGKIGNHCRHLGCVGKIETLPIACSHKSAKSGTVGKWRNPWLSGIFPDKWKPGLSIDFKSLRWHIFGMRFTWNADSGVAVLTDKHNPGWFLQLQLYEFRAWEGGGEDMEGKHGRGDMGENPTPVEFNLFFFFFPFLNMSTIPTSPPPPPHSSHRFIPKLHRVWGRV